ncbi:immune inhibitor A domain-containing protein [Nonomuraea roseoviolacea]|uniref:Immune inhibitor A n=1 Tax=Nonomuraea roseoviolacea subsp. carminata TaxID=160689 RepID=A0ABT1KCH6_9ACTN|nr:immune inhibitor A domain-containing protein [Nonomuraea roseoviolacea]MCP2351655.1 immune inhibitor A [Nonomuraea roseoviolacea subsp. carminata]
MSKHLLAAIGLVAATTLGGGIIGDQPSGARYEPRPADHYLNYDDPLVAPDPLEERPGTKRAATPRPLKGTTEGNPVTARVLAARQDEALRTGQNPFEFIYKKSKVTKTAKLLTLLVEFSDTAGDDFSGYSHPKTTGDQNDCVTEPPGAKIGGPLHNRLPDPAASGKDNFTYWVKDFSTKHYNDMLYSDRGITERVRTDLTDPRDGKKGIDVSGSLKGLYQEMSKGAYTITGEAVGWLTLPHSEAYYGAGRCGQPVQDNAGHPSNPRYPNGAQQLPVDAVNALAARNPSFPWADYDIEDVGDADRDGDFAEPDGVIDHLVIVHAGEDKLAGGGAQGTFALWAHSSTVQGGSTIPGTGIKISNYIMQGENAGVGIFGHEYGHDLGLPDLYDSQGPSSDSSVGFWDLMSAGSHTGVLFQSMPTHMGLWDKWILGWANPKVIDPGSRTQYLTLGQASRTPRFTQDGVMVNLPDKEFPLTTPHSGSRAWWSDNTQNWADVRLSRTIQVPADARWWMWDNYVIENEWDYGFVEISTDNGATWTEQKIYNEAGQLVSTDDGYGDPNGRLRDYGHKKYGLTGTSGGWRHDYVDLSAYAGRTVQLRLRYATDANTNERGWLADDFSLTSSGATVWSDDVEGGANGWTAIAGSFANTKGPGWTLNDGIARTKHYYFAEWRNTDGFDKGLAWGYDHTISRDGIQNVERVKYNAPGLVVTYGDARYEWNDVDAYRYDPPSIGSKGRLLVLDSHFDPLRRSGEGAEHDPTWHKNMTARIQSSNAAFTFFGTYPQRECLEDSAVYCTSLPAQSPVTRFTDAKTWYPGLEIRDGQPVLRNGAASVVVPSSGGQPYTTRVVHADGTPAGEFYGQELNGHKLGTGNPGDEGKALGVQLRLVAPLPGDMGAVVEVTAAEK